jgi:hypothetical protein
MRRTRLGLAAFLLVFLPASSVRSQVQYMPRGITSLAALGNQGTHLGTTTLSGELNLTLGGLIGLAGVGGTGRVEDAMNVFSGDDPRMTYYGPRLRLNLAPPEGQDIGAILIVGYEWQEFSHPDIEAAGYLKATGPVLGFSLYRLLDQSGTLDLYLDASYQYFNFTVEASAGLNSAEVADPTGLIQAGFAFAFKVGRANDRIALVRPWLAVVEQTINFGLSLGYILPLNSGPTLVP